MAAPGNLRIFQEPCCLIESAPGGKLQVSRQVLAEVEQLDGPLVVVGVAGLYRTGKSYLMNRLANMPYPPGAPAPGAPAPGAPAAALGQGFSLGSTIESHTKGIWIWVRPHPAQPGTYLLLLDTEGLGDVYKGDQNHDNWIFCLATLLSSVLCYNAKGAIDDDALKKLNFITEMSKHIRSSSKKPTDEDFDMFFPQFIYVLRDFHLELMKNGKAISEDEYLEDCLALKTGTSQQEKDFNLPRLCIRKYFKRRKCFVFDFPVMSSRKMSKLESLGESELSEDFLDQTLKFCKHVFEKAPVKKLENGQIIKGSMWATLVVDYVEAIRNGKVPNVENAVKAMAIIENRKAIEACIVTYRQKMATLKLPTVNDKVLSDFHFTTLKSTLAEFLKRAVFDEDHKFQEQLNENLVSVFHSIMQANESASRDACLGVLRELEAPFMARLRDGVYTVSGGYTTYQADMAAIQEAYKARDNLGVKKNEVLLEFLQAKLEEGQTILAMDNKVTEEERKVEEERARAVQAEQQREAAERARVVAEQQAAERERALGENIKQLEHKMAEELKSERQHHEQVLGDRLSEQQRLLSEGFNKQSEALQKQIADLTHRINNPPRPRRKKCVIM